MRLARFALLFLCVSVTTVCTRTPADSSRETAVQPPQSATQQKPQAQKTPQTQPTRPVKTGTLSFPTYSPELEKEIKAMQPGQWIPVKIDRDYLVLRGTGIRVEDGDYFVQLLSDPNGKVTRFLLAKKQGTNLAQVNLNKATARDGSFAAVIDVMSEVEGINAYTETRAYCSSSGESSQVFVHLAGGRIEWRGELMGLAGPSSKTLAHP